jgi:hypothetical protein
MSTTHTILASYLGNITCLGSLVQMLVEPGVRQSLGARPQPFFPLPPSYPPREALAPESNRRARTVGGATMLKSASSEVIRLSRRTLGGRVRGPW